MSKARLEREGQLPQSIPVTEHPNILEMSDDEAEDDDECCLTCNL